MTIEWDAGLRQFHLRNDRISYLLRILDNGMLEHLHLGPALAAGRTYGHLGRRDFAGFTNRLDDPIALELPTSGRGDFRVPALAIEGPDGSTVLDLRYVEHRILPGKPPIPGLPSTYVEADDEAETLELVLRDEPSATVVRLLTTIFRDEPAIARSLHVRNDGAAPLRLRTVMSASLDLPDSDWILLTLSGAWARERHVIRRPLAPGRQSVSSRRGASGHEHDPSLVVARPATTESCGEAIGLSLVYSGNFLAEAEVHLYGTTRLRLGIDPETFTWTLGPGEEFAAPEAIVVYSAAGLGGMSDAYHRLYRSRLARGVWRDRDRPVLINNWEGTYFDFDEERLVAIAAVAREVGVELFVLDDGWFGARDDDTTSLGDWFVDRRKLPNGIDGLARRIEALGLGFGLWIEPEMISARSRLFETHPGWAIAIPGRDRTESRQQYVLDMSRPEIVDHLSGVLGDVLSSAPISYVKWDMNRNITEPYGGSLPPDRQGEFFHRYMLGVYELYRRLTAAFPDILVESCAGGGGRFDAGMLAFAPQGWTSDDTDAVERLAIQWGASTLYPLSSMGAHVSAVPNHQTGRITPLATRAATAFFGVFGYELDATAWTDAERREVADQIAFYVANRDVLQRGRFIRLQGPFDGDGNLVAWMAVAPDRGRAIVGLYRVLSHPNPGPRRIRLRGLDPASSYRVRAWPEIDDATSRANSGTRGGDDLEQAGLILDVDRHALAAEGDFWARILVLEAIG
ncbi:MAG: alpha-galactosidase [Chloroflexi bacterium]|nr:alpha-galactosidase [Chloroflexota bacterium]